jgi:hypothetical protein
MPQISKALDIGFVDLGEHARPRRGVKYPVVSAADDRLEQIEYPMDTDFKRLNVDLYSLYIDDLPDFTNKNECLLKISVNTRDPQNIESSPQDASTAISFKVKDHNYASSFLYRGIYRNLLFREWINLKFDLFELDTGADEYYQKVKSIIDRVPEVKNLDILKGIPYLNLATNLFESIIMTFGKNPDDHVWSELPTLELLPTPGGAFLRKGIYVIYELKNSRKEKIDVADLVYVDNRITCKGKESPTHLIFGTSLRDHIVTE